MYAATWKSTDGITHLSWNVGGFWIEVYRTENPNINSSDSTSLPDIMDGE